jgi:hypothetical protein
MQAARAARRKERILKSTEDRMKIVSGGDIGDLPLSVEKRLVLDDEEMDPALATRTDSTNTTKKELPVTPKVEDKKVESQPEQPKDILDDALSEVFDDKVVFDSLSILKIVVCKLQIRRGFVAYLFTLKLILIKINPMFPYSFFRRKRKTKTSRSVSKENDQLVVKVNSFFVEHEQTVFYILVFALIYLHAFNIGHPCLSSSVLFIHIFIFQTQLNCKSLMLSWKQ